MKRMLDLFCGVGGWSKPFLDAGWSCVGVDIKDFSSNYPGEFILCDVMRLPAVWINSFDCVCASPPCEEFARAWLPWLRGDHQPDSLSIRLLNWAIDLSKKRDCVVVECSRFSARHVSGGVSLDKWHLWGDLPLMLPTCKHKKMNISGLNPEKRAMVPYHLGYTMEKHFSLKLGVS